MFKIKFTTNGSVERYKAHLLEKGNQIKGKDYKHTFRIVAKFSAVRLLLATATMWHWPLHQLDINNAFMHGFVEEEVYMAKPEGYNEGSLHQVCKLFISLYNLKQTSRQ